MVAHRTPNTFRTFSSLINTADASVNQQLLVKERLLVEERPFKGRVKVSRLDGL